jgi:serine protease Do
VGMNTAVATQAQSIGFAIAADDVRSAIALYEQKGRIARPYLGVRYMQNTKELAQRYRLPYEHGVVLTTDQNGTESAIIGGSPAQRAGLQTNDIILSADGKNLTEDTSLSHIIRRKLPGESVKLRIYRGGQEHELMVQLDEQP